MDWCRAVSKSIEKWRVSCKAVSSQKEATRQNLKSWRVLQCRGDWIRTSDLLNPIQGVSRVNCSENTALSIWSSRAFFIGGRPQQTETIPSTGGPTVETFPESHGEVWAEGCYARGRSLLVLNLGEF